MKTKRVKPVRGTISPVKPHRPITDSWVRFALQFIIKELYKMSQQLDALTAAVTNATTVEQSAITLLEGLAVQIEQLKNDPAALQALADQLDSQSGALATAVAANTTPGPVTDPVQPFPFETPQGRTGKGRGSRAASGTSRAPSGYPVEGDWPSSQAPGSMTIADRQAARRAGNPGQFGAPGYQGQPLAAPNDLESWRQANKEQLRKLYPNDERLR